MHKTLTITLFLIGCGAPLGAQTEPAQTPEAPAEHHHHEPAAATGWSWMADGVLFLTGNFQGSDRGKNELRSQNWFMLMGDHPLPAGTFEFRTMLSAEPLTVTPAGYSEIFQTGEAYQGKPNVDRQHPHDLFMQLVASWRVPVGEKAKLTIVGGPVGEATLGPVAFMHRPSALENPTAPLAHHTFDSTHIVDGVVAAAVDTGPWTFEGSVFHGREPDEHRYDITVGALDSWATRIWFRSGPWLAQASYGFLHEPEELEPGDTKRSTASLSWQRVSGDDMTAVMAAVGNNSRPYTDLGAFLFEANVRRRKNTVYTRIEALGIETEQLLFPQIVHKPHPGEIVNVMGAYTIGALRDLPTKRIDMGVGGDVTFYTVAELLQDPYGRHPVSFHVFLRIRPLSSRKGGMWNMTMTSPMMHAGMSHAGMTH